MYINGTRAVFYQALCCQQDLWTTEKSDLGGPPTALHSSEVAQAAGHERAMNGGMLNGGAKDGGALNGGALNGGMLNGGSLNGGSLNRRAGEAAQGLVKKEAKPCQELLNEGKAKVIAPSPSRKEVRNF